MQSVFFACHAVERAASSESLQPLDSRQRPGRFASPLRFSSVLLSEAGFVHSAMNAELAPRGTLSKVYPVARKNLVISLGTSTDLEDR